MNPPVQLPLSITFRNTPEDFTNYYLEVRKHEIPREAFSDHCAWFIFIVTFSYALYAGRYEAGSSLVFWIVFMLGLWKLKTFRFQSYRTMYRKGLLKDMIQSSTGQHSSIILDESGMTEEHVGIRLFAPWNCVKEPQILENILVIPLSSGQAALISGNSLNEGAPTLEQIRQLVETRREVVATA